MVNLFFNNFDFDHLFPIAARIRKELMTTIENKKTYSDGAKLQSG